MNLIFFPFFKEGKSNICEKYGDKTINLSNKGEIHLRSFLAISEKKYTFSFKKNILCVLVLRNIWQETQLSYQDPRLAHSRLA